MKVQKSEIKLGIESRANLIFEFAVSKITDEETLQQLPKQAAMSNPDKMDDMNIQKQCVLHFWCVFCVLRRCKYDFVLCNFRDRSLSRRGHHLRNLTEKCNPLDFFELFRHVSNSCKC